MPQPNTVKKDNDFDLLENINDEGNIDDGINELENNQNPE
jgi:hypothetical protein